MKWKLVPVEPTEDMREVGATTALYCEAVDVCGHVEECVYTEMLAYAPNSLDDAELVERVARALAEEFDGGDGYGWETFIPEARAAIAAIKGEG